MKFPLISPAVQTPVHAHHQEVSQPKFWNPLLFSYKWEHEFPEGKRAGILNQNQITEEQFRQKPQYVEPFNKCVEAKKKATYVASIQGLAMYYGLMEFIARSPTAKIPMAVRYGFPGLFVAVCIWSRNQHAVRDCQQMMVWNKL